MGTKPKRCGGALGTVIRGTRACRTVTGTNRATVTTISGFGAWGMRATPAKRQEARAGRDYGPAGRARPLPGFGPGAPRKRSAKHQPTPRPVVVPATRERSLAGRTAEKHGKPAIVVRLARVGAGQSSREAYWNRPLLAAATPVRDEDG